MLIKANGNGELVMSKDSLGHMLAKWVCQVRQTERAVGQLWLERAQKNMTQAHSLLLSYMRTKFWVFQPLDDDLPAMICFITLIGEALVNVIRAFPPDLPRKSFQWSMAWIPLFGDKLAADMICEGWCPSVIDYLFRINSVSALEYASQHRPTQDGRIHDKCTKNSCETYTVNPDTYVPKHMLNCETGKDACLLVGPLLDRIKRLVLANEIPVIEVSEGPGDMVTLDVHSAADKRFVAISHVWVDGLGSTTEQGLPVCQLRRLASLVRGMNSEAAFWTDGICIPSLPEVRKKAIGMMAHIYSEAIGVLVLDGNLQLCASAEPTSAKTMQVLTCGWMRRLWTLQEAILAKELLFAFSDNLVNLNDLIPPTNELLVHAYLGDLASELFHLTKRSAHSIYSIGDVARSLRWRTTSRAGDETLAIASLLGSKPSDLVDLSPEDRMKRMLQDIGRFPRNILFLNGAKLQTPGFHWAPRSFMAAHGAGGGVQLATSGTDAVSSPDGLTGMYYAIMLPTTTFTGGEIWRLKDAKTERLYEITDIIDAETTYTCDILLLLESVAHGGAAPCLAARTTRSDVGKEGTFTVHCEYVRRVLLNNIVSKSDAPKHTTVEASTSGKLTVCVA
ncbi:hypothetical protein GGI43DRAFT_409699 [Trichoderma evansii]